MDLLTDANPIEQRLVDKANRLNIPISAAFELTPICNLDCDMCYVRLSQQKASKHGSYRNLSFWIDIAKQFKEKGTLFILLTGGEPLLYPHFRELYLKLHEMGFIISVNTNGTLITKEIADLFATHRPRIVHLTMYGVHNETYENLCHVKDGFKKASHGLHLLKERGIHLRINLTQTSKNQEDYEALIAMAEEMNSFAMAANYLSLYSNPTKGSDQIKKVRNTPYQAAANEVRMLVHKKGNDFKQYLEESFQYLTKPVHPVFEGCGLTCRAGKSSCWINWQGQLQACVDLYDPNFSLVEMSVEEAWNNLKEAVKHLPIHTECKDCKLKPFCDVCYANATNEKKYCGSLSYLCQMAKAKADILYQLHGTKGGNNEMIDYENE